MTHPSNRPSLDNLDDLFTYHPPTDQTKPRFQAINEAAKAFARVILENTPSCADQTAAFRMVQQARFTANQAIATCPPEDWVVVAEGSVGEDELDEPTKAAAGLVGRWRWLQVGEVLRELDYSFHSNGPVTRTIVGSIANPVSRWHTYARAVP